jgi:hypothetical protein
VSSSLSAAGLEAMKGATRVIIRNKKSWAGTSHSLKGAEGMKLLQNDYRKLSIFLIIGLLGVLNGCGSSSSPVDSQQCQFSSGTYDYQLHTNLENDPAAFPDGTESQTYAGRMFITVNGDTFSFRGGENQAWEVTGTCRESGRHPVEITLHNDCASDYLTTASSIMIDTSADNTENGLHVIEAYLITWSCGGDPTFIAQERWDIFIQ